MGPLLQYTHPLCKKEWNFGPPLKKLGVPIDRFRFSILLSLVANAKENYSRAVDVVSQEANVTISHAVAMILDTAIDQCAKQN